MQLAGILTAPKLGNIGNCKGLGRNWVLRSFSAAMEFGLGICLLFAWPRDLMMMMITLNVAAGCMLIVHALWCHGSNVHTSSPHPSLAIIIPLLNS